MGRPRQFDHETALRAAVATFAENGFEGTSTDELLRAMGISRQSLYDTFGDKKQLYLAALHHYAAESVSAVIRTLNTASSPRKGIEAALLEFAAKPGVDAESACLGVSAICEFGRSDAEVSAMTESMAGTLQAALERRLTDAKAMAEVSPDVDVVAAAQFISSTLSGMKVSARAGASPDSLRAIALMALRSLN